MFTSDIKPEISRDANKRVTALESLMPAAYSPPHTVLRIQRPGAFAIGYYPGGISDTMLFMSGMGLLLILILFSSIPAAAVYLWFRIARYPFSLLMFAASLFTGIAAFFPALFLQRLFPAGIWVTGRWGLFVQTFIRVALTEELSRLATLLVLFGILKRFADRAVGSGDNPAPVSYTAFIQGSVVGLSAGLGFAILESAAYGVSDVNIVLLRALTAAPLHGACGSRVGSAAVIFREHPAQAVFHFLAAVAIHGTYNFMIIREGLPSIAAVLIALSALASSIVSIRGGMSGQPLD